MKKYNKPIIVDDGNVAEPYVGGGINNVIMLNNAVYGYNVAIQANAITSANAIANQNVIVYDK